MEKKVFSVIYNNIRKYILTESTLIIDILQEASRTFQISPENYNICLCTENNIELDQSVFDVMMKDMHLSYDRSFIIKIYTNYDKFHDASTQTDEFVTYFEEAMTQTDDNYEPVPVFRQNCFIGSLPKKLKLQKDVVKEELECFLKSHFEGQHILDTYNSNGILEKKLRVKLINIVVSHLVEIHGSYPSAENKILWAQATALIFPNLCEDHNPDRFEIFYNPANRGGFFGFRLRTINRSLSNNSRSKQIPQTSGNDENDFLDDDDDYADEKRWLQQACPKNDLADIFKIMAKTVNLRKQIFCITEYPRFLDTPGLIDQDFDLQYKIDDPFSDEQWRKLKPNIERLAKTKNIKVYDECAEDDDKFDSDITNLIILSKLCRTYGKKTNDSIYQFFIFEKTGTSSHHCLAHPHLVLRGPSRKLITSTIIKIDGKELPITNNSATITKFLTLFKAYFVFNCKYADNLHSFFLFVQEGMLKMKRSSLTPRLKELQNMLNN